MKILVIYIILLISSMTYNTSERLDLSNEILNSNEIVHLYISNELYNATASCFSLSIKPINYTLEVSCTGGGVGSTACSLSVLGVECSVSCGNGYYSCCNALRSPSCGCVPIDVNQLPEGG